MAVGKKKAIRDFTQGNPTKELLMFSLPIACTLILQSFYNMADTIIVPIPGHEKILSVKMAPVKALAS